MPKAMYVFSIIELDIKQIWITYVLKTGSVEAGGHYILLIYE